MKKKTARRNSRLADDIRESLRESSNCFSGKTTKAIAHRVSLKKTEAPGAGSKSAATSYAAKG
jgi:hypothetical protein